MNIRIVAYTLLCDHGRILLLKRQKNAEMPNMWDISGGLVEIGEEPEAGARRELLKETGLTAGEMLPFAIYSNLDQEKATQFITIFFHTDYAGGTVRLAAAEHSQFCWLRPVEALQIPLCPLVKEVLSREACRGAKGKR